MNARAKVSDLSHSLKNEHLKHVAVVYVCVNKAEHRVTLAAGAEKPNTRKCPDCGNFDMLPDTNATPHT